MVNLLDHLPIVPNFPKPGIAFRDICPLLADPAAFAQAIDRMQALASAWPVDLVAGVESRGLIFATALSLRLARGLVMIRKPGKLPPPVMAESYALEYGADTVEISARVVAPGANVLLVDDVIATGGTLLAARRLVETAGGRVTGVVALLRIDALQGAQRLQAEGLRVATALAA